MRGHIRRRGSTYTIVINIAPDPATGKRRQKWYSGYPNKKDAERALTELLGRVDRGTYTEPKKLTLANYLNEMWLPKMQARLKPSTYDGYAMNCRVHIIPELGGYKLQALTPGMLDACYTAKAKTLSAKTVRHLHGILHKALKDAVGLEYVARNVADVVSPPAASNPELQVWSPDELRAFLAGVAEDRMAGAWRLSATTGMRRGEILGLRWSDVDLATGRLVVQVARVRAGKVVVNSTPKTKAGKRVLQLDPATVAALRKWRLAQAQERMLVGSRWQNKDNLVFTMPDGSPITPNRFSIWFRAHVKRLGLPKIRLHDVRHSYATAGLAAGAPLKVMSARLGHATTGITENLYMHALPAMDEAAALQVAAIIDGGAK